MRTDIVDVIELGAVSAVTRGGVSGLSDGDSGMMMHPGLSDD